MSAAVKWEAWGKLSPAERVVAIKLCQGMSAKEAAIVLGLSQHTVICQTRSIYKRLNCHTLVGLLHRLFAIPAMEIDQYGKAVPSTNRPAEEYW